MATIGQLNATTEYYWLQTDPVDILSKQSALLWKLTNNAFTLGNWDIQPHETVDGGLMVKIPFKYQGSNSGGYGVNTVINQSKKNLLDNIRFKLNSGVVGSNTLNLLDQIQNAGEEATISLTKTYLEDIKMAARKQLAFDIIAGEVGQTAIGEKPEEHINGLGDLFNTNTSTEYGAIAEASIPQWKANVITDTEDIEVSVMQKIWRKPGFGSFQGLLPNFCVTTSVLKDAFELSLHPHQITYNAEIRDVAGFENVVYKGAPIVSDSYYDDHLTGVMDCLNLNFLHLRAHKDKNFTAPKWITMEVLGQPDIWTANTRFIGNLMCSNRQMQVRHTNLTVAV